MKYGKQFIQDVDEFSGVFRYTSINYKRWKKWCKSGRSCMEYLIDLERECELVNEIFINLSNDIYKRKSYYWFPCSFSSFKLFRRFNNLNICDALKMFKNTSPDILTMIHYAELNSKTITKICKKIDKTTKTNEGRLWLLRIREEKRYKFLGGILLTRLRLDYANQLQECPICMEDMGYSTDLGDKRLLILNCGHAMCVSCVYKFTGIKNNGTIYNLLLTADLRTHCPLCIRKHPFSGVSELSFWKKNEKHIT